MASTTRNVQPGLIAIGVVLVVVGAVVLLLLGVQTLTPDSTVGSGVPAHAQEGLATALSPLWALVSGLSLACGGAVIGIGLNRWFGYRK